MSRNPATRPSRRYPIAGLAVVAAAVPLAGVTAIAGAAGSKTVTVMNIAFDAKSLSVSKGTRVTFAFRDDGTTHNVTSTGRRRFRTIADRSAGAVSRTLSRTGTYRYECTLHPGMTGRITVR